jgi:hypothetical protein
MNERVERQAVEFAVYQQTSRRRVRRHCTILPLYVRLRVAPLRADERSLDANSTADGCWRKNCAGNHEGKRQADKNKNKAVFGMLTIGRFLWTLVDARIVDKRHHCLLNIGAEGYEALAIKSAGWLD